MKFPNAYFGKVKKPSSDWKKDIDKDIDDQLLKESPKSLIKILGFDPRSLIKRKK